MASEYLNNEQPRRPAHFGMGIGGLLAAGAVGYFGTMGMDKYAGPNLNPSFYTSGMSSAAQWAPARVAERASAWARGASSAAWQGIKKPFHALSKYYQQKTPQAFWSSQRPAMDWPSIGLGATQGTAWGEAWRGIKKPFQAAQQGFVRGSSALYGMGSRTASSIKDFFRSGGYKNRAFYNFAVGTKNRLAGRTSAAQWAPTRAAGRVSAWAKGPKRLRDIGRGTMATLGSFGASKAFTVGAVGVAAGVGIWAGATAAVMAVAPKISKPRQGRASSTIGATTPMFIASHGPMPSNNLGTRGLSQALFQTRHKQH